MALQGQKTTQFAGDILDLELNNIGIPDIAEPVSPANDLFISLHSADPAAGGDQETSELSYLGYARVAVARDSGSPKWTRTNGSASNAEAVEVPICLGGSETATWFGIGTAETGSGYLMRRGRISDPIGGFAISNNITPKAEAGALIISEA